MLAIVDEMAQLGPHMKSLENAMGMAAGAAGLQLWCVLQDLSQLKGMFPQYLGNLHSKLRRDDMVRRKGPDHAGICLETERDMRGVEPDAKRQHRPSDWRAACER